MEISLSAQKWEIKGYWPYVPVKEKSMETGQTLQGVTDWIPARVPGGVHYDLWKAGLIENPYYGKNSLHCEWVENRWWMYRTTFPALMRDCDLTAQEVSLVFKGLDYEAAVFLNDEPCGEHTGMYDCFCVDLTGKIREENKLVVIIKSAPQEMGQIGYTSLTSTQKSRFNYKWDFSTRLVNLGIWQDVVLKKQEEAELADLHVDTDYTKGKGQVFISGDIRDCRKQKKGPLWVRLTLHGTEQVCMTKLFRARTGRFSETLIVENPALWYPNGAGKQPLYRMRAELLEEDGIEDKKLLWGTEMRTGIRSLSMAHNEQEHENALPYTFVINGQKIYIKGMNITPLDHIYGNVTREQYAHLAEAMRNAGVNLVRVWGGGLIEKEEFYDLCDENGILVWQEFIQSSSGIDNKPCEDAAFLKLLKTAAAAAVREKRNHVCLAVYSGGNELMEAPDRPCGCENQNLAMLQEIVCLSDGRRPFLPTSASGPREFVSGEKKVSHDVHGNWRYEGNPGHYVLYGESDSLFHSEFGMDGTCSEKSLRKFLPEASLHPTPMSQDSFWQHHGEWWGTYYRDCSMFGPIEKKPENLAFFTRASQYMQAEGLRFIVEADRRRAFQNSGVIIWQLNEPWPNASCTSLIDYYGETKTAYYQVKRAYEPRHISVDYRSLILVPGEKISFPVYVSNSGAAFAGTARVLVRNAQGKLLQELELTVQAEENRSTLIGEIALRVPEEELLFLTAMLETGGQNVSANTYLFGTCKEAVFAPLRKRKGSVELLDVTWKEENDGRLTAAATIRNAGPRAVLDAGLELKGNRYYLLGNDNDVVLFPGEERTLYMTLIPKRAGTFLETENWDGTETPEFALHWL